jgi:hypothetical protein
MQRLQQLAFCFVIGSLVLLAGCRPQPAANPVKKDDHAHHDHSHEALGPHNGHILELGQEQYHAEWTHDDASGKVSVYILDKDMKKEVPIGAETLSIVTKVGQQEEMVFNLEAVAPTTGEKPQSAQFEIIDKQLVETLSTVGGDVSARLEVTIEGQPFSAKFESHADHDH